MLWLDFNKLSGEIPPGIVNLTGLKYLDLRNNFFNTCSKSQFTAQIQSINTHSNFTADSFIPQRTIGMVISDANPNIAFDSIGSLDKEVKVTNISDVPISSQLLIDFAGISHSIFTNSETFYTIAPGASKTFTVSGFVNALPAVTAGGLGTYQIAICFGGAPETDVAFSVIRTILVGVVLDLQTQRPIEGAKVALYSLNGNVNGLSQFTNSEGKIINFGASFDDNYRVVVSAPGYQTQETEWMLFSLSFGGGWNFVLVPETKVAGNEPDITTDPSVQNGASDYGKPQNFLVKSSTKGKALGDGQVRMQFGSVSRTNKMGKMKTLTITNTKKTPLRGLRIVKDGKNPSDFIIQYSKEPLKPKESMTVKLIFRPQALMTREAELHIYTSETPDNPFDLSLSGIGVGKSPSNVESNGNLKSR